MGINIVWFKRDLRLSDHQPLAAALALRQPLLLIYILEPELLENPHYRRRHWHFIAQSLADMNGQLEAHGGKIWVLEGEPTSLFATLNQTLGIDGLFSYEETGLEVTYARDRRLAEWTRLEGCQWQQFPSNGVERGRQDRRGWNARWSCLMAEDCTQPDLDLLARLTLPLPDTLTGMLCRRMAHWQRQHPDFQAGGESSARDTLHDFLTERAGGYQRHISKPLGSRKHCSRLSPYLAWGNLSIRQVSRALAARQQQPGWGRPRPPLSRDCIGTAILSRNLKVNAGWSLSTSMKASMHTPGITMTRWCRPGAKAQPGSPILMPACAACRPRATCTSAPEPCW